MKNLGRIIKKFDKYDWYFLAFLTVFFIISLFLLNTPPIPDEGTHSLIAIFFRDLINNIIKHPTLSFSKIYNYAISYLVHCPKLSLYYPPLLHIIVSFFYAILGASFFTGRFVVLLFSVGTLGILYKISKTFFNKKIALFSTILFATTATVFYYSITMM